MKTDMSRREFFGTLVPVAAHIRTLGGYRAIAWRACKWSFFAACLWFAWKILSGVPLDGWRALGWMALKFVLPALMLVAAFSWSQRRIVKPLRQTGRNFGISILEFPMIGGEFRVKKHSQFKVARYSVSESPATRPAATSSIR